jgi:hypothetical protein
MYLKGAADERARKFCKHTYEQATEQSAPPESAADVKRMLAQVMADIWAGKMDPKLGSAAHRPNRQQAGSNPLGRIVGMSEKWPVRLVTSSRPALSVCLLRASNYKQLGITSVEIKQAFAQAECRAGLAQPICEQYKFPATTTEYCPRT